MKTPAKGPDGLTRCAWPVGNELMVRYHDEEWGVPVHDARKHFEFLVLDAFQAGLSWAVVLNKREAFREAFHGFEPERVARFNRRSVERMLRDDRIIRNRQKIEAAIHNARAFVELEEREGSFDDLVWGLVGGSPRHNRWRRLEDLPARTEQSDEMSAALRTRGFKFVGSTICYAYMQAAGMVNDHVVSCFRHDQIRRLR